MLEYVRFYFLFITARILQIWKKIGNNVVNTKCLLLTAMKNNTEFIHLALFNSKMSAQIVL